MTQQSKLSEALAATLLRFKEIDRDTIEALCKQAASLEAAHSKAELSLEQMAIWRSNDNSRERDLNAGLTSIFSALNLRTLSTPQQAVLAIKEIIIALGKAQESRDAFVDAEKATSEAYLRLREILGALNAGYGPLPEQVWQFTEAKASSLVKSHNQLQWALRELLAQTRDLHDEGPEDDSYQSDALQNAIAVADALVGEKATEQYPIADEPLNRRIQELEVRLSRAEEPDLPQPLSYDAAMSVAQNGTDIVGFMRGANWMLDQVKRETKTDKPTAWSENALRKLMEDVLADRETELASAFNEAQKSMHGLMATTLKQSQENLAKLPRDMDLKSVITVTGDEAVGALVKDIINTEMLPGGRIHKALIGH